MKDLLLDLLLALLLWLDRRIHGAIRKLGGY